MLLQPDSRWAPGALAGGLSGGAKVRVGCGQVGHDRHCDSRIHPPEGPGDLQVQAEKNKRERSKFSRASKRRLGGPAAGLAGLAAPTPSTQAVSGPPRQSPADLHEGCKGKIWGHHTIPHLKSSKLLAPPPLLPYSTLRWEPAHSFPRSRLRR